MPLRYPAPLRPGDVIGVTAPSSGVPPALHPRLDAAIAVLRDRGFEVREGVCLRDADPDAHVSGSREARADELMAMLVDPDVAAVVPPWGGETGIDLLPLLDLDLLAASEPCWYVGWSDISTTLLPLTLRSGWATLHGGNLMDTPYAAADGHRHWLDVASADQTTPLVQQAADLRRAPGWDSWEDDPTVAAMTLTEPTRWRSLDGQDVRATGRLVGGCIEVLSPLAGTPYAPVPDAFPGEDLLIVLEAAGDGAYDIARMLHGLRLAGWFDRTAAVLVGRTPAPDAPGLTQAEAVRDALGDLDVPVVLDLDVGHQQPQMPLVLGAPTEIVLDGETQQITQTWA